MTNNFYQDHEFDLEEAVRGLFHSVEVHHASELSCTLFHEGATVDDIEQEFVGNCFFLAALGSLIEKRPGLIEQIIEMDENYKVKVHFHDETIVIDAYLPCVQFRGKLTPLSANTHSELWVPLLHKAFVKYLHKHPACSNGVAQSKCRKKRFTLSQPHYELVMGGLPQWCWEAILGKPTSFLPTKPHLYDEIYRLCSDKRYVVNACSCGSSDKYKTDNIVNGHAYSILGAETREGERLIKLRNPWGKTEPKNKFTTLLSPQDDGVFYLTEREMLKYFPRIFFCKID